jgi:hypothetical protein
LAVVERLPAPISEIESPTPAPEQSVKSRPKPSPKLKPKSEARASATRSVKQTATKESRFAGTWVGIMRKVPWGNVATTLVIDSTETTMLWEETGTRKGLAKTLHDGDTLQASFVVGGVQETWSLTPESDGKTGRVRLQELLSGGSRPGSQKAWDRESVQTAVFRRVTQ